MTPDYDSGTDFVQRRSDRISVDASSRLRSGGRQEVEVRMGDMSQTGFMAECHEPIGIGSTVSLDVPGLGAVHAQVRWQIGGRIGGMFLDPISLSKCEWTAIFEQPPAAA